MLSEQHGWMSDIRTLGSQFEFGVPFGVYLDDDVDLKTLNYTRILTNNRTRGFIILLKMIFVFVALPFLILFLIYKYML